uniref:ATP-binding cassette domain-containing protein n=1 Tax=Paenibacillus durus TaxID=44251 RepID=UPI00046FFFCA
MTRKIISSSEGDLEEGPAPGGGHPPVSGAPSPGPVRDAPALEVSGITKSFARLGRSIPVLEQVSLTVKRQEFVSIVGPSGCGKSTLFHIIGGLVKPDAGAVRMNG